jgi:hypothetical protein
MSVSNFKKRNDIFLVAAATSTIAQLRQKTSKALQKNADKKSGHFSDAPASFFVRLSMKIGADPGKNNGI